jgi:hypothetical protein
LTAKPLGYITYYMIDKAELQRVMQALGKRGGRAKSRAKTVAARRNASKPRRRFCKSCTASLTTADRETGACTQCGLKLQQPKERKQ